MGSGPNIASRLEAISGKLISAFAGIASFLFTLAALLLLSDLDDQVLASLGIGLFALLIVWVAAERPNSAHARAVSALIDRLLAVRSGDLISPAPPVVARQMPALAAAVDNLFEQVRSNLDDVNAMALYDPVTALPNRIHFRREADRLLASRKDERFALLFIDLDGFKEVNDRFGHARGDQVLSMVAQRLREQVKLRGVGGRPHPLLARLAGDEFTMLLPGLDDGAEAEALAANVVDALCARFDVGGQSVHLGGSIGIALCPEHGDDLSSLMKAADVAMYAAKADGRSRTRMFHAAMAVEAQRRAQTEQGLREAFERQEFELAFQPQLCLRTGAVVAGEALLRWHHPELGVRLPDTFIAQAEESNLIIEIGDWVAEAAVATLARWQIAGHQRRLSFNVSPRQAEQPDFFDRLRDSLDRVGCKPGLLELELTETSAMRCGDPVLAQLSALRQAGVSIAIDDFGAGYSNLARLKDLPIDRVKLDRGLISDVDASEDARTIVAAVVHMIHGLGLEAVAEGVEREEQSAVLRAIGCDLVQGFAYAGALSECEFLAEARRRGGSAGQPSAA